MIVSLSNSKRFYVVFSPLCVFIYAAPSLPLVVLFVQAPVTEEGAGIVLVCQPLLTPLMGDKSMIHIPAQR